MAAKKTTKKKAPAKKKAVAKPKSANQERWIRNLRNVHVSLRIEDRRVELAPRGQRGDMAQLKKGEVDEVGDVGVLCEIITRNEAENIREKQTTNIQQRRHPALDNIRNERGEEYGEDAIKVEQEALNDQGKKVADLKDGQVQIDRGVGIRRSQVAGTQDNPLPDIPDSVPPEQQADWLARQKRLEGPAAGLGEVSIVREEPQKPKDGDRSVKPTSY